MRDFKLADYWQESIQRFEASLYRETAVLVVSPRGSKLLQQGPAAVAESVTRTAKAAGKPDGWLHVLVPIESVEQAVRQVLMLGADAEVLQPVELRSRLAQTVRLLAERYVRE